MNIKTELSLKIYGDEILRKVAEPFEDFNSEFKEIVKEMNEIMKLKKGIGLAAPQVGLSKRFFIVNIDKNDSSLIVIANPKIIYFSKDLEVMEEGCLSVPGIYANVIRSKSIVIQGLDINGKPIELTAMGLLARVFMHETDHLDGKLFIDRIDDEDKEKVLADLKKSRKIRK